MKEFRDYDQWKTDPSYVHPEDADRVLEERVLAASKAATPTPTPTPTTPDEINLLFDDAALKQRNQAAPVMPPPLAKKSVWHANRAFDEANPRRAEPER